MAEELVEELEEGLEEDSQKGKFMTFQTGKEFFGISINYVNEIIVMQPIAPIPEVEDYIEGLINLRGKIIPVIDIRKRFKMNAVDYTDRTCIIVLDIKSTTIGLIVDKIAEVDTIPDEDIMPPPTISHKDSEKSKYVYGLARMGSQMKMLLDPEKLILQETVNVQEEAKEEESA